MRFIVVTGTSTGVGKTFTTAALARCALDLGIDVGVVKPAQTGVDTDEERDIDVVRRLSGLEAVTEVATYADPLAPDTAARLHSLPSVGVGALAEGCLTAGRQHELVVVEGAGGILVRLDTAGATLATLAGLLQAAGHDVSVVVVTSLALGTLNHTELTVAALRQAALPIAGLVVGELPAQLDLASTCNQTELPRVTGLPVLGILPHGLAQLAPAEFRRDCASWLPGVGALLTDQR